MIQSKYPFQLGIIIFIVGLLAGSNYIMQPAAAQSPNGIVVDHNSVALFEKIPDQYIQAAASMDMLFIDRSVGANISDGLSCLSYASDEVAPNHCKRYQHVDPTFSVSPSEVDWSRAGGFDRTNWDYMTWATGCDGWSDKLNCFFETVNPIINQYDVVSFQYSYLLVDEGSTIANQPGGFFSDNPGLYDIYDLEAYEASHPDKEFIYWTTSLARPIGTSVSESFNDQMRQYAATHNKILFDVADILSHDPDGNPCYDSRDGVLYDNGNSSENYPTDGLDIPAICQHYTSEVDGGHLGNVSAGKIRVAKAFWVLMAQIAGWSPVSNPSPSATPTSTPTPTLTPTVTPLPTDTPLPVSTDTPEPPTSTPPPPTATSTVTPNSTPIPPSSGLVSYWSFGNDHVMDDINGCAGCIKNGAVWFNPSIMSGGYNFNGSNSSLNLGDFSHLDDRQTFTISVWIRPNFDQTHNAWRFVFSDGGIIQLFYLSQKQDWRFMMRNAANTIYRLDTKGLEWAPNTWHLLTVTYDGSKIKLYWDGRLSSSRSAAGPVATDTYATVLGMAAVGRGSFDGDIDELRIYDYALSEAEVSDLFVDP